MNYRIGSIVLLQNGKSVYITEFNSESNKYSGVNVDVNNPQEVIRFEADEVAMEILK